MGEALAVAALVPELPTHEYTYAADPLAGSLGQALPGGLLTHFTALQVKLGRRILVPVAAPWRLPVVFACL